MARPVALLKESPGTGAACKTGCHSKRGGSWLTEGSSEGDPGGDNAHEPSPQANSTQASTSSVPERRGQRATSIPATSSATR